MSYSHYILLPYNGIPIAIVYRYIAIRDTPGPRSLPSCESVLLRILRRKRRQLDDEMKRVRDFFLSTACGLGKKCFMTLEMAHL